MASENEFESIFDKLITTRNYRETLTLLRSEEHKNRLKLRCSDAVQACLRHLTDENYEGNLDLYSCCEEFLKYIAAVCSPEEVLLEILEIIETSHSDHIFTTALKALQITLRRQEKNRVNGLEWSLNSIHAFITELSIPGNLARGYDEKEENLLEQDKKVDRILMTYMTVTMFLEPLVNEVFQELRESSTTFRDVNRTRRNILSSFLLQLLGRPLALLDLSNNSESVSNVNSLYCARKLSKLLCSLLGDPYFLLPYVEYKVRWTQKKRPNLEGVYENAPRDMFMLEEKSPHVSLSVFFYLILSEKLISEDAPKVYHPLYIFEMCLYLENFLFNCNEPALQYKGIRLGLSVVDNLKTFRINRNSLDLKIHQDFCTSISKIIVFSTVERNRKQGLQLLTEYMVHFDAPGQLQLLHNLVQTTKHSGLKGYLIGLYKNLLAKTLDCNTLQGYFHSPEFKHFFLKILCTLPQKAETDIIENSEYILATLNAIRYLAIRDKENRSGFWNFLDDLLKEYLEPLRTAIDLSRAHFKAEQKHVTNADADVLEMPPEFAISLDGDSDLPKTDKQHKLRMLEGALLTFDLMESLLARLHECLHVKDERK